MVGLKIFFVLFYFGGVGECAYLGAGFVLGASTLRVTGVCGGHGDGDGGGDGYGDGDRFQFDKVS